MVGRNKAVDVSIVLPCLNEAQSLAVCIEAAREALDTLSERHGLGGEILLADNGSTDGSQALAMRLGARVVAVAERGYGAALRGGFTAARGRFLVMGDADGSYNFREAVPMVEALMAGADLCMGSRFKGGIAPGAMPWKNRYIGNPLLTGVLNLLFRTGASDAHCGLRAITKACFERLALTGSGMEFASEMVIKAALKRQVIAEVPATLSPDLRDRPPHLRPWRDGWRHLRYLLMLSPVWLFAVPAVIAMAVGLTILASAAWAALAGRSHGFMFGNYWVILAAAVTSIGHISGILGGATHLFGVRAGFRMPKPWVARTSGWLNLETMLVSGVGIAGVGLLLLIGVAVAWFGRDFSATESVLPAVLGALCLSLGAQNVLGGFLLAVLGGNESRFVYDAEGVAETTDAPTRATRPFQRAGVCAPKPSRRNDRDDDSGGRSPLHVQRSSLPDAAVGQSAGAGGRRGRSLRPGRRIDGWNCRDPEVVLACLAAAVGPAVQRQPRRGRELPDPAGRSARQLRLLRLLRSGRPLAADETRTRGAAAR
jgi:hypothetical protein